MRISSIILVLLVCSFASADPAIKTYRRTNGWKWQPDSTNKNMPSCMDKFGHDAGSLFVSYFGSIDSISTDAKTVTISAGPNVPSMVGSNKNQSKGYYMVTSQDSFFGKIGIAGHNVVQLVNVDVDKITSATVTMLVVDGNTALCDDSFFTVLEIKP